MPYQFSVFHNAEGEAEYLAAYEAALARWPVPFEELSAATRFGPAHVIACGPRKAPPLLLLQGMGLSAAAWEPCIPLLSANYRVYAPDIINDLGKTALDRMVHGREDFTAWLCDLLDGLKLDSPAVIGQSFGGWLGLSLALDTPRRISRLVAVSPTAALGNYPLKFMLQAFIAMRRPSPERAQRLLQRLSADADTMTGEEVELFNLWLRNYRPPKIVLAAALTDDELRRIATPTLLLFGERDTLCPPRQAAERGAQLLPSAYFDFIAGAGHWAAVDKPLEVCAKALEFLAGNSG